MGATYQGWIWRYDRGGDPDDGQWIPGTFQVEVREGVRWLTFDPDEPFHALAQSEYFGEGYLDDGGPVYGSDLPGTGDKRHTLYPDPPDGGAHIKLRTNERYDHNGDPVSIPSVSVVSVRAENRNTFDSLFEDLRVPPETDESGVALY